MKLTFGSVKDLPKDRGFRQFDEWKEANEDFIEEIVDAYDRLHKSGYRGVFAVRNVVGAVSWERILRGEKPLVWNAELSAQLGRHIRSVRPEFKCHIKTVRLLKG